MSIIFKAELLKPKQCCDEPLKISNNLSIILEVFLSHAGDICPEGFHCPEGSYQPVPCGNGTYMNHTGADTCYLCPEGYYCVNRDRADICRQGFYCPAGTGADLQPCPMGTFGNTTGLGNASQCTQCTGGSDYLTSIYLCQYQILTIEQSGQTGICA